MVDGPGRRAACGPSGPHSAAGRSIPLRKIVVRVRRGVAAPGRSFMHKPLQAALGVLPFASIGAACKGLWITGDNTRTPTMFRLRVDRYSGAFGALTRPDFHGPDP